MELLLARRVRLELSMAVQRIFHDMVHVLDWCDEIKVSLLLYSYCWFKLKVSVEKNFFSDLSSVSSFSIIFGSKILIYSHFIFIRK